MTTIRYEQVNNLNGVYRWTDEARDIAGTVWSQGGNAWGAYTDTALETVATAATREYAVLRAVELATESLTDALQNLVDEASGLNWMGEDSTTQARMARRDLPEALERVLRAADRVLEKETAAERTA